jgi:flagellar M-ring protein FliF
MIWSSYWGALSSRQRVGLSAGVMLIIAVTIGVAVWLLRDPYVSLASGLSSERLNELTQELDLARLDYRIGTDSDSVSVEQSQLGKARAAISGGQFGVPANVGLELFKETDFSSTEFAQRINYQRALQGELARTIQSITGVRRARVHVILADAGLFKRNSAKASAAVSIALQPGELLTPAQVRGIQRLVTASVPEIRIDDVVVLDESGASLTRAVNEGEGELSSAQLDLKRQADLYLESKLQKLLRDLVPEGTVSLSVDTVLDQRQLRVTTEEPIATRGPTNALHATGVLVKGRQSHRGGATGYAQAAGDVPDDDSTDWEYEYSVGRRVEQILSAPGSIKRLSVAVALRGAPAELSNTEVEQLVANAVGIDRSRGDSVKVSLLPGSKVSEAAEIAASPEVEFAVHSDARHLPVESGHRTTLQVIAAVLALAVVGLVALLLGVRRLARSRVVASDEDVEAMTAKVRQWLNEGSGHGR